MRTLQLVQHIKHCVLIFGHLIFECFTHSHLDYRQQSSHVIHTSPYSQHTRSRVALQHTSKHVLRGAISRSTMCMWFDWCDCVGGSIISHVMVDETIICERDPTHTRPHVSELLYRRYRDRLTIFASRTSTLYSCWRRRYFRRV